MKKKVEVNSVKTVKVKIENKNGTLHISNYGRQVDMKDKDENYIKKAFTQFSRAQEILHKYMYQE